MKTLTRIAPIAALVCIPAKGAIGLQHHGAAVDFANLWIKTP